MRAWPLKMLLTLAIIAGLLGFDQPAFAKARGQRDVNAARAAFAKEDYDLAIKYYRQYLRSSRLDYDVWGQLGASYYHAGLPRKALKQLNFALKNTSQRSFNYFYQGLCYLALGRLDIARRFLISASKLNDNYASRSVFEMATIEYNAKDRVRANYWLATYLQRFPRGAYARLATQMKSSLTAGTYIDGIKGTKKPDMEKALFRYNSLSLSEKPHFWLMQFGYEFNMGSEKNPSDSGGVKTDPFVDQAVIANAAIGIGPIKAGKAEGTAGYQYSQRWLTDGERIDEYVEDWTDISYQPYRTDLLERSHQFFGDYRRPIGEIFHVGAFASYERAFSGSSFGFQPDDNLTRKVLDVSETTMLVPWVGARYLDNYNTIFYLYVRKELDLDAPEFSNKSYQIFGAEPVTSLGISQYFGFPKYRLDINLELFSYEFIYNDYWLDFTRQGGILRLRTQFFRDWFLHGYVGSYQDSYQVPVLKQDSCSFTPSGPSETGSASGAPKQCARVDNGLMYQAGIYYNWNRFTRYELLFTHVQNSNSAQTIYDQESNKIIVQASYSFPSVDRAYRYVNRFSEAAFSKSQE